jgi:hypothetical protein
VLAVGSSDIAAMMEATGDNGEWSREVKKEWDAMREEQQR